MNNILSIYGSHDASAVFFDQESNLKILEYERFCQKRYAMLSEKFDTHSLGAGENMRRSFFQHIKDNSQNIDHILYMELTENDISMIKTLFPEATFEQFNHHTAHAASGFFTSPFDKALVISIDGGGLESQQVITTKSFLAFENEIQSIKTHSIDLGNPYSASGFPISEINGNHKKTKHDLASAGKVMGLCAYGNVRKEWESAIYSYFVEGSNLGKLSGAINKPLTLNALSGQDSYDFAKTIQHTFEKVFYDQFWSLIEEKNLNVILVGGCALNVLLNQSLAERLKKIGKKLYVPPNPNDCGLALGAFLFHTKQKVKEVVYNGFQILDIDDFESYIEKYKAKKVGIPELVSLLKKGNIIGVVQGCSEVGPRALGNRSIICDPSYKNMKDTLNAKVKFREWFRPFAPVCRLEDKDRFFINAFESPYMSHAPTIREKFQNIVPAIVHVDNTARLQTVTLKSHSFFYNLLTELEKQGSEPLILNTSFNIKGKPILTTIKDAIFNLESTQMDYVYIEGYLFKKQGL